MRLAIQIVAALIVLTATVALGYRFGTGRGPRSIASVLLGATPAAAAPLTPSAPTGTPTETPTATQTSTPETATPVPRITLPPVFTPTTVKATPIRAQSQPSNSASTGSSANSAPAALPNGASKPGNPPAPTFTPTRIPTATPTATPTPQYDFVVVQLKEIPQPEYRNTAIIRGRLIDQKGNLVPGAYFQIDSDGTPRFETVEPHGTARTDGTATFVVTKGRFSVRVLGGRSQYAGWMVTGANGVGSMSDWEFTFQTTRPIPSGILVSPTSTPPPTPTP